jgi:hypothetical protein
MTETEVKNIGRQLSGLADWRKQLTADELKRVDVAIAYMRKYHGAKKPNSDLALITRLAGLLDGGSK